MNKLVAVTGVPRLRREFGGFEIDDIWAEWRSGKWELCCCLLGRLKPLGSVSEPNS